MATQRASRTKLLVGVPTTRFPLLAATTKTRRGRLKNKSSGFLPFEVQVVGVAGRSCLFNLAPLFFSNLQCFFCLMPVVPSQQYVAVRSLEGPTRKACCCKRLRPRSPSCSTSSDLQRSVMALLIWNLDLPSSGRTAASSPSTRSKCCKMDKE